MECQESQTTHQAERPEEIISAMACDGLCKQVANHEAKEGGGALHSDRMFI